MTRVILTIVLLLAASRADADINGYASLFGSGTGSATTVATQSWLAPSGAHVTCGVRWTRDAAQNISSITDVAGNTYTQISTPLANGNSYLAVYYAQNITADSADTITATFSAAATNRTIICVVYTGVANGGPDITVRATQASGATVTAPAFTTANADEVILAFGQEDFDSDDWSSAEMTLPAEYGFMGLGSLTVTSVLTSYTVSLTTVQTAYPKSIFVVSFTAATGGGGGGGGGSPARCLLLAGAGC